MSKLTIELPDGVLDDLGLDAEHALGDMRLATAMQYYRTGRLHAAAAAEFAAISLPQFLCRLSEYGIPAIDMTDEELAEELRNAYADAAA